MFKEKSTKVRYLEISLGKMLEIHKVSWPFVSLLFALTSPYSTYRMHIMNGLYSVYGTLWSVKSSIFPDMNFYTEDMYIYGPITGAMNFMVISLYYLYPYLASINPRDVSGFEAYLCIFLFLFGSFWHYGADSQKYFVLKRDPNKLITDGFFKYSRNPAYFGELVSWSAMTFLAGPGYILSYLPLGLLVYGVICVGIPKKDASLSRYEGYSEYKKRTNAFIPIDKERIAHFVDYLREMNSGYLEELERFYGTLHPSCKEE